jgi:hypothetical protein
MANLNLTSITSVKAVSLIKLPSGLTINPLPVRVPPVQVIPLTPLGNNSVVPGSSRTRPLWFDGRLLAAPDLMRDQNYFLQGQATLGRAAGFGVIHGLTVVRLVNGGEPDAETMVIGAGQGITPGGNLVMLAKDLTVRISDLAEEQDLNVQFGLSETPVAVERTRTGLYVVALRPVQFTANPITSYPSDIQGSRMTHDGSIIEATAVSLIPYPIPAANFDSTSQNAAAARQVFVENNPGTLSDSLLPIAMISVDRNAIQWLDEWMVRRDSGPELNGLRFGLADIATQQAYLRQFDAQLQQIVGPIVTAKQTPNFPATAYFQALPPAGRFPFATIDTVGLTQNFFPSQTNVTLSLVPEDELAALIEDSMSLPPIDLTLAANAYADLAILMLVPVARKDFGNLAATLQPVGLSSKVPPAVSIQSPLELLRLFPPAPVTPPAEEITWQSAIGQQTYGYFVRRRSVPAYVSFTLAQTKTTLTTSTVTGSKATRYSATVTPAAATGAVVFKDGTTVLGTADIHSGIATLVLPALADSGHSFTASYLGDTNYAASTSLAVKS